MQLEEEVEELSARLVVLTHAGHDPVAAATASAAATPLTGGSLAGTRGGAGAVVVATPGSTGREAMLLDEVRVVQGR